GVPSFATPSGGHVADEPVQVSATSHSRPGAASRQITDEGLNALLGHTVLPATHCSAMSQISGAGRQVTVGAADGVSAVQVPFVVPPAAVLQAIQSVVEPFPQAVLQQ